MNNLKQLETREVNVGENIFYIRPLPAFKAANMTGELAALVLPLVSGLAPLLSAVDTEKEGNGLLDIKVEDAAPAIAGAFSSLDGDKVEKILSPSSRRAWIEIPTMQSSRTSRMGRPPRGGRG